jgi:hypothetical protein
VTLGCSSDASEEKEEDSFRMGNKGDDEKTETAGRVLRMLLLQLRMAHV